MYLISELPDLTGVENLIPDKFWEWVKKEAERQLELKRILDIMCRKVVEEAKNMVPIATGPRAKK